MRQYMKWLLVGLAAVAMAGTAAANAAQGNGKKGTAPKETVYDAEFIFPDNTYSGTMTLTVVKGTVSGTMLVVNPQRVTGDVAGTLKGTKLALDYAFTIAGDQPCTGRVVIDATMDAKGIAKGTVHATDCGDPLDGTFTLKRHEDK